jgi:hypothetical protein
MQILTRLALHYLVLSGVHRLTIKTECCLKVYMWIEPLRFLLRKCLTVSDVGELGRVILPKVRNPTYLCFLSICLSNQKFQNDTVRMIADTRNPTIGYMASSFHKLPGH